MIENTEILEINKDENTIYIKEDFVEINNINSNGYNHYPDIKLCVRVHFKNIGDENVEKLMDFIRYSDFYESVNVIVTDNSGNEKRFHEVHIGMLGIRKHIVPQLLCKPEKHHDLGIAFSDYCEALIRVGDKKIDLINKDSEPVFRYNPNDRIEGIVDYNDRIEILFKDPKNNISFFEYGKAYDIPFDKFENLGDQ
ncbi:MAG: hypothetical protein LBM96_10140 [Methanobrevibacter sp.]|jgi:hypothetical protein|nr:hypothetical protein [Candidatus Methanoflexus mossambicus]